MSTAPTVHRLFEAQVDRRPDRVACRAGGQSLTYRSLDEQGNQLARRLMALGVGRESRVAIHLERSVDMLVAILGVLKAGGAYVPLDPEHPVDRLRSTIEDAGAVVLVSRRSLWPSAQPPSRTTFLCLDGDAAELRAEPVGRLPSEGSPEDLAYVIYTSGSTGGPKGVMVTHHNVVRLFTSTEAWMGFGADDVWTLFHSFAFDFSVWEMWGALLYGGSVVIVPHAVSRAPAAMARLLDEERVTVLCQTPSAFRRVAPAVLAAGISPHLRYVIFGGEALDFRSLRPWFDRFGDEHPRCINMYGITETTVHVTYRPLSREDASSGAPSCIGVPLPDLEILVWNEREEPVGPGESGELVVAGAGLARGYLDRPELTRERFVERGGRRLYRSGDLVRRLPGGDMEYLGRDDGQVKIRGFRVETGEIAGRILDRGDVADAVVRAVGQGERARLVAYCVLRPGCVLDRPALRRFLRRTLPDHMLPAAFVALDELPLTVNGKLDVAALPEPEIDVAPHRAPETATERLLAELWREALGAAGEVGLDDDFLALGGASIAAAEVLRGIQEARGVALSFRDFFDAPTLADLARTLDARAAEGSARSIAPRPSGSPPVLSFAEEQLHVMSRLARGLPLYAECIVLRMTEGLDRARLERAVGALVARHAVLRATYVDEEGSVRRVAAPGASVPVAFHDLRLSPPERRDDAMEGEATARLREGFDSSRGPLLRVDVYALEDRDHRVVLSFSHIILDGVSSATLVGELATLYREEAPELPPVALEIDDVAAFQRARLDETRQRHLPYWRARLSGLPELDLPTDHPRPPVRSFRGARLRRRLPAEALARIRALGGEHKATLFTTLLGAFFALLHRLTGQRDIAVGAVSSGRRQPEAAKVVGCLVNPVVLRQAIDPGQPFTALLAAVRDTVLDAHAHDELPFAALVRALGVAGDPAKNPLFQVAFSANVPIVAPLPGWSAENSPLDTGTARFDLSVQVEERAREVDLLFEYSLDLFEPVTVGRIADRYATLLDAISRDASTPIGDLPVIDAREERSLLAWGRGAPLDGSELVLDRIRRRVRERPHATAAIFEGATLSYEELDRRSDDLADRLTASGAGREAIVGLAAPPSFEWLIGMIGILKAGAAFLPLDAKHPRARLSALIEDARVDTLCATDEAHDAFTGFGGRWIDLATCRGASWPRPQAVVDRSRLAYVIHTSGSTGTPKGVQLEHGGLASMVEACLRVTGLTAADRIAQLASPCFDACIFEVFPALSAGGTLVIAPPRARVPGREMADLLSHHAVTVVLCAPSTLAALPSIELPSLRLLCLGGDKVGADLVDRWARGRSVLNLYGPTEATVFATAARCEPGAGKPPIGRPIAGARAYIVDERSRLVPAGVPGELLVGGPGVARGYLNRPELTAERFVPDPFSPDGGRLYRTGDLVRFRADGQLDFLSRIDRQVKIRGFRVEPGEIEATLRRHPRVAQAVVSLLEDGRGAPLLCAHVVPRGAEIDAAELRAHVAGELPAFMVPSAFVSVPAIPISPNGKVDLRALPAPSSAPARSAPPSSATEREVASLYREVLHLEHAGADDAFFEIGGDSLSLSRVQALLRARFGAEVEMTALLRLPTVRALAAYLDALPGTSGQVIAPAPEPVPAVTSDPRREASAVAIIGMAMRGPGVRRVEDLWPILAEGREAVTRWSPAELGERGRLPGFVPAEGVLDEADAFDAELFGVTAADAALMDPQHRVFLEAVWAALESAGCDPRRHGGRVGVFGGAGSPRHWLGLVASALAGEEGDTLASRAELFNAPEFLTSRAAFKLGLRGPAITVNTACSTSLAAVHLARQALLSGECDAAIAGGVSIASLGPEDRGYVAADGGILSPDGRCRPFGADARGTVKASGVAVVVLKRLADAERDGDPVRAVLLGSAMNNDGAEKIGFSAPSEEGQARVLEQAYAAARVAPASVAFVQAHGTGTALGDAIEVAALKRVFGPRQGDHRISLTSVKANLGHLDTAAGAAGLIAAVLALEHRSVPGMPGVHAPNPLLGLSASPFVVHECARPLPDGDAVLRAGVSSLGMGGTNVHVVLAEAPRRRLPAPPDRTAELLRLSARTAPALDRAGEQLARHLRGASWSAIVDTAYTLAVGRTELPRRRAVVLHRGEDASQALADPRRWIEGDGSGRRSVALLFPGQGAQSLNMGRALYREHPAFRAEVDSALDLLRRDTGLDLAPYLLDGDPARQAAFAEAGLAQPATFIVGHALARLLGSWGLTPSALLGHSLGEYVAACLAGVFSLRDALRLLRDRGRLMETVGPGAMVSVLAERTSVEPLLGGEVSIATEAPGCTVISGPVSAVRAAEQALSRRGLEWSRLPVTQAYHSRMMTPIRDAFAERVGAVTLRAPSIPMISCITGRWLGAEEATSADYWADHLVGTVTLTGGLGVLLSDPNRVFVDVGPGKSMHGFLRRHLIATPDTVSVTALPTPGDPREPERLLEAVGRLWAHGVAIDGEASSAGEPRRRVPLPTYPFERQIHRIGGAPAAPVKATSPFRLDEELPAIEARAEAQLAELRLRTIDDRPGVRERLDTLSAALVGRYFAEAAGLRAGLTTSTSGLRRRLGIVPKFDRMLDYLLGAAHAHGLCEVANGEVRWLRDASPDAARAALLRDHPELAGLVRYLDHCTAAYPGALSGQVEPVGVLYPDGTDAFYRACMAESAEVSSERFCLRVGCAAALDVVRRLGRRARLLEVGAGHGSFTWPLVESLAGEDVEYRFTDIGRSFLRRAEEEAARRGLSWLSAGRLDLDQPLEAQGYARGSFDVVLGFNAVHTARDTATTVSWLHDLLASGGVLILVEATRAELWDHLVWGLAPGFWDTGERPGGSLVHRVEEWQALAERAGFGSVAVVPHAERARHDHVVVLAQREITPAPRAGVASAPLSAGGAAQAEIAQIWKRLLGVAHVDPGASFFDLGGDSLLAVQLLAEIRLRFGVEIGVPRFSQAPTIEWLARLLPAPGPAATDERPSPTSTAASRPRTLPGSIVPLQTHGERTPLFCVHALGGSALSYARLAASLDGERPVYGVQATTTGASPSSLAVLARDHVEAVRAVQPEGPYFLAGWSFGALLAHEMARQLEDGGETVGSLTLIDAPPTLQRGGPLWRAAVATSAWRAVTRPRAAPEGGGVARALRRAADVLGETSLFLEGAERHAKLLAGHSPGRVRAPVTHFRAASRAWHEWLVPSRRDELPFDPAGPVSAHDLPGDHFSILSDERSLSLLAAGIRAALDEAESTAGCAGDEADLLATARRFLQMSAEGPMGHEVVDALFVRGARALLFDSYDGDIRGFDAIRATYAEEYQAIACPQIRMYDPFVRVAPGGLSACVAALIDATLVLRRSRRPVTFQRTRVTWVFEKHGGVWKIAHVHYSIPVGLPLARME